jgi:serine/threonine protein kinase
MKPKNEERKYYSVKRTIKGEGKEMKQNRGIPKSSTFIKPPLNFPTIISGKLETKTFSYLTNVSPNFLIDYDDQSIISRECINHSNYKIQLDTILGKGSYGSVYASCFEIDCKYATKVLNERDIGEREAYFLYLLQRISINGKPIVPRLLDVWCCNNQFFYTMNRYDENMETVGRNQFDELAFSAFPMMTILREYESFDKTRAKTGSLFTTDQLMKMFGICEAISQNGIIGGDLKPDQFLFKKNNDEKKSPEYEIDIVLTDFGLSKRIFLDNPDANIGKLKKSSVGWSGSLFQCSGSLIPELFQSSSSSSSSIGNENIEKVRQFNMWQLSSYLFHDITFVFDPPSNQLFLFLGFDMSINVENFKHLISEKCSKYNSKQQIVSELLTKFSEKTGIPFFLLNYSSFNFLKN